LLTGEVQTPGFTGEIQMKQTHLSAFPCHSFLTCEVGTRLLRLPLPRCPCTVGSNM